MIPIGRVLREKRRVVVPLLVVLAANVALYAAAVYPLERRVASAEQRGQAAESSRAAAEREHAAAQATVEGKDRADQELRRFYREVLPADQAAARRITYLRLARLAREADLEPGRARFDTDAIRDSALAQLRTTLDLTGDYRAIRRFIYLLESSPEFAIMEHVTLAQVGADRSRELRLTLAVSTYFVADTDGD
jgi:Tfp pilus assembly protein PilO